MSEPMRIRAQWADGLTLVAVLIQHDMETGLRKDSNGTTVPAWYIHRVSATLNGRQVLQTRWGTSVAKNPVLRFTLRGARPGDRVAVQWEDNLGQTRSDEATVS